jgi:hypothetical protein
MSQPSTARDAVNLTLQALHAVDDASLVQLTRLNITEIQALKQDVAEILPASNLPAFLLQGLIQLESRMLPRDRVQRDLGLLAQAGQLVARGVYGAFLATPAVALIGYQKLLKLAGKDLDSAFPEGTWQFYTQFGLREDQARHANETTGFHQAIPGARPNLAAIAWVVAAIRTIWSYGDLLRNEWQERVFLRCVEEALAAEAAADSSLPILSEDQRATTIAQRVGELRTRYGLDRLAAGWTAQRPYRRHGTKPYARARRQQFFAYVDAALGALPPATRATIWQRFRSQGDRLARYQDQMSILATLDPEPHQDQRVPIALVDASVAMVVGGRTYLIPMIARAADGAPLIFPPDAGPDVDGAPFPLTPASDGTRYDRYGNPVTIEWSGAVRLGSRSQPIGVLRPPALATLATQVQAILDQAQRLRAPAEPSADRLLAAAARERMGKLQDLLPGPVAQAVQHLGRAPIVLNWDEHNADQPLGAIRMTHRGVGAHALTIIRTTRSFVFDQSHIFFDAMWGMALSEIITGEAIASYPEVAAVTPECVQHALAPLPLDAPPAFLKAAREAVGPAETHAETDAIDLVRMNALRKRLGQRGIGLTVNDLLILARCMHASTYAPSPPARQALDALASDPSTRALPQAVQQQLAKDHDLNPALLVPMDGSAVDPRERLFPVCVRNPFTALLPVLDECWELYKAIQRQSDPAAPRTLVARRPLLYAELLGFSEYLLALKQVTMQGQSFNTAAIRLLAHLPPGMQRIVDLIPQKIGMLNEILKGREVFSNVGQVARTASLTRFTSARDDGATKLLIWGIMADAAGRLQVSLRDFRPHVAPLVAAGRADLATLLAQDYLDAYARAANVLVGRLHALVTYAPPAR